MKRFNILVLGAAYGLVPALRMLSAGHRVTVVCRPNEREELARDGAKIIFSRSAAEGRQIAAPAAQGFADSGALGLVGPDAEVHGIDIVFLAMSEPHYAAPEVAAMMRRLAVAKVPVVSLMNMVPPSFLARMRPDLDLKMLAPAYGSWDVWQQFAPELMSAASPDAQAVRLDPTKPNELTVTLGSNFKIAPFADPDHQAMVAQIAADVAAYRPDGAPLTVRLMAHDALHVPLAKWPMLIAGNCRCIQDDRSLIPIRDAVHADLERSEAIYNDVLRIVEAVAGNDAGLVPFRNYARAAKGLSRPSSFGRAVAAGGPVERVDKMIQLAGRTQGIEMVALDEIVARVDGFLTPDQPFAEAS